MRPIAGMHLAGAVRRLSSNAKAVSPDAANFNAQRQSYKAQMSELRKQWKGEFDAQAKMKTEMEAAERHRIVLERAVRLRELRKISQEKQEALRKHRAEALRQYRLNLARTHVLWEENKARGESKLQAAVQDIKLESSLWITPANMEEKINDALFDTPGANTGLSTPFSEHLKFQTHVNSFRRLFTDKLLMKGVNTETDDEEVERYQISLDQKKITHRLLIEQFLEASIGTGEERAKHKELVKDFTQFADRFDLFSEVDDVIDASSDLNQDFEDTEVDFENLEIEDDVDEDDDDSFEEEDDEEEEDGVAKAV